MKDLGAAARWPFLAAYLGALCVGTIAVASRTRRVVYLAGVPLLIAAAFTVQLLAAEKSASPDARVSSRVELSPGSEQPFTTVAIVRARARGLAQIHSTLDTLLYPATDRPHMVRVAEDGRTTLEFPLAYGQRASVGARGFASGTLCEPGPCTTTTAATHVGLDLPDVDAAVDVGPAWTP